MLLCTGLAAGGWEVRCEDFKSSFSNFIPIEEVVWAQFDLVDCRWDIRLRKEFLEVVDHVIADTDCAAFPLGEQGLHGTPGIQPLMYDRPVDQK